MIRTSRLCVFSRLRALGRSQRVPPGMTAPAKAPRLGPYQFRNRKARLLARRFANIPNAMKSEHLRKLVRCLLQQKLITRTHANCGFSGSKPKALQHQETAIERDLAEPRHFEKRLFCEADALQQFWGAAEQFAQLVLEVSRGSA